METYKRSILILGEASVGKTHYGAQLLKRLIVGDCVLRMGKQGASNLEPFEVAMECLTEGVAAEHTATKTYVESIWPITDEEGHNADMIWPDYGGEQVRTMILSRKVPRPWQERVLASSDWILLLRLQTMRASKDIFSRPLRLLGQPPEKGEPHEMSDQARLIELLQMLLHVAGIKKDALLFNPSLTILLTCWDELGVNALPHEIMQRELPMLMAFVDSTWHEPAIFGLSALERPLDQKNADKEYANRGPERFGYVILPDGTRTNDITLPIQRLLARVGRRI
jgi:hypothetical protein